MIMFQSIISIISRQLSIRTTQQSSIVPYEGLLAWSSSINYSTDLEQFYILNNSIFEQFCTWIILYLNNFCHKWIFFLDIIYILLSIWKFSFMYIIQLYLSKPYEIEFGARLELG